MLLCCHPALDVDAQVALTLRLVGGLTTAEIASAFLLPTATLAQRIVRAKRKIRDAGMRLSIPNQLDDRIDALLGVLYLVFNEGYLTRADHQQPVRVDLMDEAIRLTHVVDGLFPGHPEIEGLLALELFHHARLTSRTDSAGDLVLLDEQDRAAWDEAEIRDANAVLGRAMARMRPGPYQVQAVIAGYHANATTPDATDWDAISRSVWAVGGDDEVAGRGSEPSGRHGHGRWPQAGLRQLDAITGLDGYHLYHAARGELLLRSGDASAANDAFQRALALTDNPAERRHLVSRTIGDPA